MTDYGAADTVIKTSTADEARATNADAPLIGQEKGGSEGWMEMASPYLAETVGAALIVFTFGCCHFCGDSVWNPTAMGCILTMAVYSFASISGAHLNPAVSVALGCSFKFPWRDMLGYIAAQVAGGFLGCFGYWAIFGVMELPTQDKYYTFLDIGAVEGLYTFMMAFVFMNCRTSIRNNRKNDENHFFAIAVGFVYIAGGYATQGISGGMFNPAATLAIGLTATTHSWLTFASVIGFQLAGGWLASVAFAAVRPEDFDGHNWDIEKFEVYISSKVIGELLGTFIIVMTVGLNIVTYSPAGPWSSAAAYISLIYSLGDVSGGHFNPAVTLAAVMTRRDVCSIGLGQTYVLQQLIGGALAGVVYSHFQLSHTVTGMHKLTPNSLKPGDGYNLTQVCFGECLFTSLFCFVFLAVATSTLPPSTTKTNFYFALAIGSCMTIGGFAIGPISGGCLNPAVALGKGASHLCSLGIKVLNPSNWWKSINVLWYALFEMLGGALGAFTYSLTHQKEYLKDGTNYPHVP